MRRSSDLSVGAIDIFGPYEPHDLLPIFVTIIFKQFKENSELQALGRLQKLEDNQYELQEEDGDDEDVDDDVDNNARRKRQRKAGDDEGSRDRDRGGNRGRRGRTRKGGERTGHQKGGGSDGASNMSLIKQDEVWMRKPGNRLHFVRSLFFR